MTTSEYKKSSEFKMTCRGFPAAREFSACRKIMEIWKHLLCIGHIFILEINESHLPYVNSDRVGVKRAGQH